MKHINDVLNYFNLDRTIFIKHRTAIQQRLKIKKISDFIAKIKRFGKIILFSCYLDFI